jgi:hypothetical protein
VLHLASYRNYHLLKLFLGQIAAMCEKFHQKIRAYTLLDHNAFVMALDERPRSKESLASRMMGILPHAISMAVDTSQGFRARHVWWQPVSQSAEGVHHQFAEHTDVH